MHQSTESRSGGTPARAGVFDMLSLGASLGAELLKGKRSDPAAAHRRWADHVMKRDGGSDIDVAILPIEMVGNRAHSNELLGSAPDEGVIAPGHTKTEAMSFLAPAALTIASGEAWRRLRPFNEEVLGAGETHPFAQTFVFHIRAAFAAPVHTESDIRTAMGRAMVKIVLGDVNPHLDPARDVVKLLMAGADVTMMASALMRYGVEHLTTVREGLEQWLREHDFASVREVQGVMSQQAMTFPSAFERAQYVRTVATTISHRS